MIKMKSLLKEKLKVLVIKTQRFLTMIRDRVLPENRFLEKDYRSPFLLFEKEQLEECYLHFKKHFKTSIFLDSSNIRKYAITKAVNNDPKQELFYLEFGVWKGQTINQLSKYVKKIYGFDSFEGLKEDWLGMSDKPKGTFNLNKKIPKLNSNVEAISGWIQDTLPNFLEEKKPTINFLHIDVDTYETTKFILENVKSSLNKNCVILFDELYNIPGWDVGEYKALTEVFSENEYKFLAFSKYGRQAVIQLNQS